MSAVEIVAGVDFTQLRQAVNDACSTIDHLRDERADLKARNRLLESRALDAEAALADMVEAFDECQADSEGRYPVPDSGCLECTAGCVPNDLNSGLCAYHRACSLLKALP